MTLLDGKKISSQIKEEIKKEVNVLKNKNLRLPKLVTVIVGEDKSSLSYVKSKIKGCEEVGFLSQNILLPSSINERELLDKIDSLNNDDDVDGFIVQLPLPNHIDEQKIILAISKDKDVDGFHPYNLGKLLLGQDTFISATPLGILELIRRYEIDTTGMNIAVLGRSNIVGKPIGISLIQKMNPGNATVTFVHTYTKDMQSILSNSDMIIAAIGKPKFVTADMVKVGSIVIDVGINSIYDEDLQKFRLVGDVDFENVALKAAYITPVPGGVGLMTVTALLLNTLKSYKIRNGIY